MKEGDLVRVEKGRRTGVIVNCPDVKDGQVCVLLNGKRLPLAHRHYRVENVQPSDEGRNTE